ncbi:hypothetical protein [Macrococcoides bohemicum]|nr:hypothetical protein [Macrococcus bohemicus]
MIIGILLIFVLSTLAIYQTRLTRKKEKELFETINRLLERIE